MEEFSKIAADALLRYFAALRNYGYVSYYVVDNIMTLIFLEELLDTFILYLSEDDFRAIIKCTYCLSGNTCMVDYPNTNTMDTLMHNNGIQFVPRITEGIILRQGEGEFRNKE